MPPFVRSTLRQQASLKVSTFVLTGDTGEGKKRSLLLVDWRGKLPRNEHFFFLSCFVPGTRNIRCFPSHLAGTVYDVCPTAVPGTPPPSLSSHGGRSFAPPRFGTCLRFAVAGKKVSVFFPRRLASNGVCYVHVWTYMHTLCTCTTSPLGRLRYR